MDPEGRWSCPAWLRCSLSQARSRWSRSFAALVTPASPAALDAPVRNGVIAFTSSVFAVQLAVMQPIGRTQRVLQRHPSLNYEPVASPDGSRLAFVRSRTANTDLGWAAAGGEPTGRPLEIDATFDPTAA
jgi:WD40-like Beta Propeller Repeat